MCKCFFMGTFDYLDGKGDLWLVSHRKKELK